MKLYEYLSKVFANNEIDVEYIRKISVVYLKCPNKFDHTTWELVHKELIGTSTVPINPMHIEEWNENINNIFRVVNSKREELVMDIKVILYNGRMFHSVYCINPMLTPMTLMD